MQRCKPCCPVGTQRGFAGNTPGPAPRPPLHEAGISTEPGKDLRSPPPAHCLALILPTFLGAPDRHSCVFPSPRRVGVLSEAAGNVGGSRRVDPNISVAVCCPLTSMVSPAIRSPKSTAGAEEGVRASRPSQAWLSSSPAGVSASRGSGLDLLHHAFSPPLGPT